MYLHVSDTSNVYPIINLPHATALQTKLRAACCAELNCFFYKHTNSEIIMNVIFYEK